MKNLLVLECCSRLPAGVLDLERFSLFAGGGMLAPFADTLAKRSTTDSLCLAPERKLATCVRFAGGLRMYLLNTTGNWL